jgi:hypothetical protein
MQRGVMSVMSLFYECVWKRLMTPFGILWKRLMTPFGILLEKAYDPFWYSPFWFLARAGGRNRVATAGGPFGELAFWVLENLRFLKCELEDYSLRG